MSIRLVLILSLGAALILSALALRRAGIFPLQAIEDSNPPARQSELLEKLPMDPKPLHRATFDAAQTMAQFPPVLNSAHKQTIFRIACPPDSPVRGTIVFSRWPELQLPRERIASAIAIEVRPDFFTYDPPAPGCVEWHMNFADPTLFIAYGIELFAQDELQVAEHPALASVLEALTAARTPCDPVERGRPRPVLFSGVERRCRMLLDANAAEGRPNGLYGNHFSRASLQAVERATQRLNPPTVSNILALAAPRPYSGAYTEAQIELILATAYSGFRAAVLESRQLAPDSQVVLHTGYWGCGAFGGNRELMSILQLEAARLAGAHRFVFHAGDATGSAQFQTAQQKHAAMNEQNLNEWIRAIAAKGYRWGLSDGN